MQFLLDNCNQNNKSNMCFYKLPALLLSVDYRAGEFLHIYQSCFFKFSSFHKPNVFCEFEGHCGAFTPLKGTSLFSCEKCAHTLSVVPGKMARS